jgi:hypothetical protein
MMRRWIRTQLDDDNDGGAGQQVDRPRAPEIPVQVQTLEQVSRDIFGAFQRHFPQQTQDLDSLLSKLTAYRLVDRVCDVHKGRYIRWVRLKDDKEPPKLHKGAVAVNVIFTDDGTLLRCKITRFGYIQCRFDQCLVFERLTDDEQLLMAAAAV